jgi:diguanylate cyclase (GGDEF)-like protein
MAASDLHPRSDRLPSGEIDCLTPAALRERLEEELVRAERHGTKLSCLLVKIDNLDELASEHGSELREQTIAYVAGALGRELRRFDRVGRAADHDLLIILPGTDGPRGEIVARRALERLRTIKVEAEGTRRPLHISVGLAAWREGVSAEALLAHARAAVRSVGGDQTPTQQPATPDGAAAAARQPTESAPASARADTPPALGRAGGP